jgi:glutathione peroxidase
MTRHAIAALLALLALVAPAAQAQAPAASCPAMLSHPMDTLGGEREDLCQYAGKVLLVVNTASFCGYTGQYAGLQSVYDKYRARGLVVLGFPSNDFNQETGGDAEIAEFCDRTYRVKFPLFAKSSLKAGKVGRFYDALAKASGQRPAWNFHKYLVARDGRTVASFGSRVEPQSAEMVAKLEELLR